MEENRIKLTAEDIYNQDFKIDTRGYRPKEVDDYLDIILSDYEEFFKILKEKEVEKAHLLDSILKLKQENRDLKMQLELNKEETKEDFKDVTNLDLMVRLAKLEKIVYGMDQGKNSL